jgi:RNA polymerase sigma-70 factor (family 1)
MLPLRSIDRYTQPNGELAFEELYKQYFVRLFRFCLSIVHRKEPAEEIVQDVFLQLWQKRDVQPPITNAPLYLYIAVRNRSLNYLRDNASVTVEELSERCDAYMKWDVTPEALLVSSEALQRVRIAINELPPRCRLIFSLVKEDGLKQKEVARLLTLSLKTVEAQLVIAMKRLMAVRELP